jgi:HD superfamily phosphodiesterase
MASRLSSLIALVGLSFLLAGAAPAGAAEPAWRTTVRDFAKLNFRHPAWGYSHCVRDYALARELAAADGVTLDDDVLFAAAFLHDMAAFPTWEKAGVDHADRAADTVDTLLKDTGFPLAKLEPVRGAIRTHMYDRDPVGPEARYLHDADALDWLGAVGVARIFALVDPNGGKPTGPEAVKMLQENLEKVPGRVMTPAGKTRAPRLAQELRSFLAALKRETAGYRDL